MTLPDPLVFLVEDDAAVRKSLAQTLELEDVSVIQAGSVVATKPQIYADFPGVILSDIRMPGKDGFDLLEWVRGFDTDLPVVLLTGEGDVPMAVRAIGAGAYDFLQKPCPPERLLETIHRALSHRHLILKTRALERQLSRADALNHAAKLGAPSGGDAAQEIPLADQMDAFEHVVLSETLRRHQGKVTEVAQALGLPRKTLYDKLARQGISARDFRQAKET